MKVLKDIGLLFVPGVRGLLYLNAFISTGSLPGVVIVQGTRKGDPFKEAPEGFVDEFKEYFDSQKTLQSYIDTYSLEAVYLSEYDVNSKELEEAVLKRPEPIFIFSGGGIIKPPLLETGKRFIHIHPGRLPDFRGSTCYYYSILKEGTAAASAFFMEAGLDSGEVIARKEFEVPRIEERYSLFFDLIFDPWVRAELLGEVLNNFMTEGGFHCEAQDEESGETYYIIHPILKHLAIIKQLKE